MKLLKLVPMFLFAVTIIACNSENNDNIPNAGGSGGNTSPSLLDMGLSVSKATIDFGEQPGSLGLDYYSAKDQMITITNNTDEDVKVAMVKYLDFDGYNDDQDITVFFDRLDGNDEKSCYRYATMYGVGIIFKGKTCNVRVGNGHALAPNPMGVDITDKIRISNTRGQFEIPVKVKYFATPLYGIEIPETLIELGTKAKNSGNVKTSITIKNIGQTSLYFSTRPTDSTLSLSDSSNFKISESNGGCALQQWEAQCTADIEMLTTTAGEKSTTLTFRYSIDDYVHEVYEFTHQVKITGRVE